MSSTQQSVPQEASEAIERLPQRRPASLYDVAVQYSIFDWYETVTSGDLDFDLAPEYLAFMTPAAKSDLLGEPDNALVVYVDLADPESPKFRDEQPIAFESVDASGRFKLGHSYPANKTSAMTDYSITTHKDASEHHLAGQRDDAWGTNNIKDRFTQWAHSEAADRVLERDVEEAWILEALRELGTAEDRIDELVTRGDVPLDPEGEETEHEVFVTIRIKLPGENRYRWPGEVPILNEVMVEQKAERFENISVDDAGADGIGYVSGEEDRVTGGSVGLLGMYAKKQREHFADLSADGSEAWRNRPLTHEIAAAIATANSVFEEFFERLGDGRRLYVFPYLGGHPETIDPEEFDAFVREVFMGLRNREASSFQEKVNEVFYEPEDDAGNDPLFEDLDTTPMYGPVEVATVFQSTGNPDRIFFEELRTDTYRPRSINEAHTTVLSSAEFWDDGIFADVRDRSESPLLVPNANRSNMALFGGYFDWTTEPTRTSEEAEGTPKAGDIDDIRARRLGQFLQGEKLPVRTLLEEYLHLLVQEQRDLFDESDGSHVPARQVVEQYAQLRALDEIEALGDDRRTPGRRTTIQPTTPTTFATVTETASQPYHDRTQRLEDFIDTHAVLSSSEPHQAVFLLGGLVGRITAYQRREGVSSTLVRRYPIDYLTKQSVKEVTNEVIQMNNTYIESDDALPSTYNARYTDRLPDLMLASDPSDWNLTQNELQWVYALGITYGSNDTQIDTAVTTEE